LSEVVDLLHKARECRQQIEKESWRTFFFSLLLWIT
jgi:hypothetical protein